MRVEDAYRTESKRSWTYHLRVAGWPDPRGEKSVTVRQGVYDMLVPGGCVDADWRRGELGDGWVSGYLPNTTNTCEGTFVE